MDYCMIWSVWAVLLITHGAFSRWAEAVTRYALASLFADVLMIAIALITLDQLQGFGVIEFLRYGLFFVAFGFCGRQLMNSALRTKREQHQ